MITSRLLPALLITAIPLAGAAAAHARPAPHHAHALTTTDAERALVAAVKAENIAEAPGCDAGG